MGSMTSPADPLDPAPLSTPEHQSGGTATLERTEQLQEVEPGDAERFAHYVRKEKILESAMSGEPVLALCGKVWVPGRDPNKFPVCPECKAIYDGLRPGKDGGKGKGGKGKDGGKGK